MSKVPILGGPQANVADLRPEGIRQPKNMAEWINHPTNAGMKQFVLDMREGFRNQEKSPDLRDIDSDDAVTAYLAGFMTGMALIQGAFIGSDGFKMAAEAVASLPAEYTRPGVPVEDPEEPNEVKT